VITRDLAYDAPGCEIFNNVETALNVLSDEDEIMVIGGAHVFEQLKERVTRLYLTDIDIECPADIFFPAIDLSSWKLLGREEHGADEKNAYPYVFSTWER
jgi:dihydrofolate reductase